MRVLGKRKGANPQNKQNGYCFMKMMLGDFSITAAKKARLTKKNSYANIFHGFNHKQDRCHMADFFQV